MARRRGIVRGSAWLFVLGIFGVAHARPASPAFDRAKCAECRMELARCLMRSKDDPPAEREKKQQKCIEATKSCMSSCRGPLPKG
jgi:hypothetical protein